MTNLCRAGAFLLGFCVMVPLSLLVGWGLLSRADMKDAEYGAWLIVVVYLLAALLVGLVLGVGVGSFLARRAGARRPGWPLLGYAALVLDAAGIALLAGRLTAPQTASPNASGPILPSRVATAAPGPAAPGPAAPVSQPGQPLPPSVPDNMTSVPDNMIDVSSPRPPAPGPSGAPSPRPGPILVTGPEMERAEARLSALLGPLYYPGATIPPASVPPASVVSPDAPSRGGGRAGASPYPAVVLVPNTGDLASVTDYYARLCPSGQRQPDGGFTATGVIRPGVQQPVSVRVSPVRGAPSQIVIQITTERPDSTAP